MVGVVGSSPIAPTNSVVMQQKKPLDERLSSYFYFHGVKGALLHQLGRPSEAREAFDRAISLAHTPAEAAHIRQHLDHLDKERA